MCHGYPGGQDYLSVLLFLFLNLIPHAHKGQKKTKAVSS